MYVPWGPKEVCLIYLFTCVTVSNEQTHIIHIYVDVYRYAYLYLYICVYMYINVCIISLFLS